MEASSNQISASAVSSNHEIDEEVLGSNAINDFSSSYPLINGQSMVGGQPINNQQA